MITIKRCTLDDLATLQTVSIETFTDTFAQSNTPQDLADYLEQAYNLTTLRKELLNQHSEFYFIQVNGQVAGFLKINVLDAQTEKMADYFIEIQRIYVRTKFKRQHLGSQLMDLALRRGVELHKHQVWLGVWEKNFTAQKFYESKGFKRFGSHRFCMGDSVQTDYILTKDLRENDTSNRR